MKKSFENYVYVIGKVAEKLNVDIAFEKKEVDEDYEMLYVINIWEVYYMYNIDNKLIKCEGLVDRLFVEDENCVSLYGGEDYESTIIKRIVHKKYWVDRLARLEE